MRAKSIRWTLFAWYAVILAAALAGLGLLLHVAMERTLYHQADTQIDHWLITARHKFEEYPPVILERELRDGLPTDAVFFLWINGQPVASSLRRGQPEPLDPEATTQEGAFTRDDIRQRLARLGDNAWLLLAKDVGPEHQANRALLRLLLVAGAGILAVALAGGWLLVSRALRPIDRMSRTAQRISGDNLGERIDTTRIHSELGQLAHTLNASFDRLEAAFERQARFTADASHELRTPLAILISHLELALRNDRTAAEFLDRVEVCMRAARRMKSVVEDLLTLARVDAGELPLERVPFDLGQLVEEVRSAIAPLAGQEQVTVHTQVDRVTLAGDRERLRQVVTNLLSNAVHYNKPGGRVDVSVSIQGGTVVLRVSDTGIGIPAADQPRIFERFHRVDPARSRERGGAGLGLAIVRWIVETHGGSISVASRPGEGSVFTVRLPAGGTAPPAPPSMRGPGLSTGKWS